MSSVVDDLLDLYGEPGAKEMQHIGSYELPSEAQVANIVDMCRALLFPGYAGPDVARLGPDALRTLLLGRLDELRTALHRQVDRALHHKRQQALGSAELECIERASMAATITERFLARLPALRRLVRDDLRAAFEGDPAASGLDEILLC